MFSSWLSRSAHALFWLAALASLGLASACADDGDAPDSPCSVGSALLTDMFEDLDQSAPACQSASDCALVDWGVACRGSNIGGCGAVIHKAQLDQYAEGQAYVTKEFCAAAQRSKYGCSLAPSCAALHLVCEAGRCTAKAGF
jgi:hypothetical protein